MQRFYLVNFNLPRVVISFILIWPAFFGFFYVCINLQHPLFAILLVSMFVWLLYYYSVGYLWIETDENRMLFTWKKKWIFNYKRIDPVEISDIHTLVVDEMHGKFFLRRIDAQDRKIKFSTLVFLRKDMSKLLENLSRLTRDKARIVDTWDLLEEKGYLRIIYRVYLYIGILWCIVYLSYIAYLGFKPKSFLGFLFLPIYYMYGSTIRAKLKKSKERKDL